jgi:hypothetical protein
MLVNVKLIFKILFLDYEIAMTAVVANTDEDLAIPYSNKNNIIYI